MRKIAIYMIVTLDGKIAPADETTGFHEPTEQEHQFANDLFATFDTMLFGRTAYEGFVGYWDTVDLDANPPPPPVEAEFARFFRKTKRVVFSRSLEQVEDRTTLVKTDPAAWLRNFKAQPGTDLLLVCGPELLAALMDQELVDEFWLLTVPMVLGNGKALFHDVSKTHKLKLIETKTFDAGSVMLHYGKE